jgi:hypothetical protein
MFYDVVAAPGAQDPESAHLQPTRSPLDANSQQLWHPLAAPWPYFCRFLDALRPIKKSTIFRPVKNDPKSSKYRPLGAQGLICYGFSIIFDDLFGLIFEIFAKRRKIKILIPKAAGDRVLRFTGPRIHDFWIIF